jgi:hypothetical protein
MREKSDPIEMEKLSKFTQLVADAVMLSIALDISAAIRRARHFVPVSCLVPRSGRRANQTIEQRTKHRQQQHSREPAPASDLRRLNQSHDPGDDCGNDAAEVQHETDIHCAPCGGQATQKVRVAGGTLASPELSGECRTEFHKGDDIENDGGNAQDCDGWFVHCGSSF